MKKKIIYLILSIATIFCFILIIHYSTYLYKTYTWQDKIKTGMTKGEVENVIPNSNPNMGFATSYENQNYFYILPNGKTLCCWFSSECDNKGRYLEPKLKGYKLTSESN